ncbi:hypothetical protein AC249_AIPGENE5311 [Exaiptasia diaphana]|nr:hypothetical protein AC249_AIPGENE5311 [Exaiptasia diaphana]
MQRLFFFTSQFSNPKGPIIQSSKISSGEQIRLELWEDAVDQIQRVKSYHIQNLKVKVYNDVKYINTTKETKVNLVDDLQISDLTAPEIQGNIVEGTIISVDIRQNKCCLLCNADMPDTTGESQIASCSNCKNSFLKSITKTKLVCKLIIKDDDDHLTTFTAFNGAVNSFLLLTYGKNLKDFTDSELKLAPLTSEKVNILVDHSTKVITQFI